MAQAIPFIVMGISAIASLASARGQEQAGQAQQQASEYNARILEDDSKAVQQKAKYDEEIHRERVRQLLSQQRAAISRAGVTIEGTPLLATLDTIEKGEMDALAIRHGGQVEAKRKLSQASVSRFEGQQARQASRIGAGTTLLTGLGRTIGMAA